MFISVSKLQHILAMSLVADPTARERWAHRPDYGQSALFTPGMEEAELLKLPRRILSSCGTPFLQVREIHLETYR